MNTEGALSSSSQGPDTRKGQPFFIESGAGAGPADNHPLVDVRAMALAFYRYWWVVGIVLAAFLLAAVLYLLLAPRTYEATARIEVSQLSGTPLGATSAAGASSTDSRDTDRAIQTEVDLLQTRETARLVLAKLKADKVHAPKVAEYQPENLQKMLNVVFPRNSRIIPVTVQAEDAGLAALVANTYSTVLIEENLTNHRKTVAYSRDYLAKQLNAARVELERSRRAPIAYAQRAGIVDASEGSTTGQGTRSLTTTSLLQLNSSYAEARVERIRAQQRWQQAQSTPLLALPEVIANSAVQGLIQQKAILQAKLSQDRQRYGVDYPGVIQQTANIATLNEQITRMAENVRNSLRDQYNTALQQEQALSGNVSSAKRDTLADQARGVDYGVLQREADTSQALYDALLQRYKEVNAEAGVTTNNITLVDRATAPDAPASPDTGKTLAVAIALGLIAGIIAAFVRSQLDARVHDSGRLARDLRLPLIAAFDIGGSDHGAAAQLGDPASPLLASASMLVGRIELGYRGRLPHTLCLVGCATSASQSTIATALAQSLAQSGRKVLLIGPGLEGETHGGKSLSAMVSGASVSRVVDKSKLFSGDFLPLGGSNLPSMDDLDRAVGEIGTPYDVVVIDAPALLTDMNGLRLASIADASLLVFEEEASHEDEVKTCVRMLQPITTLIGSVVAAPRGSRFGNLVGARTRAVSLPAVAA